MATPRASNGFRWSDHEPTKIAPLNSRMEVHCSCGWKSESHPKSGWAMDQYRAHVTSLMPKHDDAPPKATKVKRLEHYGQTRGRRK